MLPTESKDSIEHAANAFLDFGVGKDGKGWVIIRSGAMGAYVKSRATSGRWIEAYWTPQDERRIVDVTGESFRPGFQELVATKAT
jgi:hypothetical protein